MSDRPRLVLGTAGHIDHGKTSLIRALTGVDTDRLPEERERGITIELGFAPLELSDETVGVIDVPGHEKLVRTMVSGASGIDLVLLVVAADEGVMPQTREHVAVCDLLGIETGVVALTKTDIADPEIADLAEMEIQELLAEGSLAGAPCIRVSARSGDGIEELRRALDACVARAQARTRRDGPPRLSVDRAFSARGFGSIVTGTLVGGAFEVGDDVTLYPGGASGRIRGLQSFGEAVERAPAGVRCAINIQGVDLAQIRRGQVVGKGGTLPVTKAFDAEIRWLPDAGAIDKPTSVSVLNGTAEVLGRMSPLGDPQLKPGEQRFVRVHLDHEKEEGLALLPGDRVILRGFSRNPKVGATLGGGATVDVAPVRRRHSDPWLPEHLAELRDADPVDGLLLRIRRTGFSGVPEAELALVSGIPIAEVSKLLGSREREAMRTSAGTWLAANHFDRFETDLLAGVGAFHEEHPIRPGIPRSTLAACLPENTAEGAFELTLERLRTSGRVEVSEGFVRDPEHLPMLSQREEAILAHIRAEVMSRELEPPTFKEWKEMFSLPDAELRELLAFLEREGSLTRAPGELWFDSVAVDQLREKVRAALRDGGELDTQTYKDMIGTTRKYAVPLMELFDAERVTLRRGEARVAGARGSKD